MKMKKEQSPFPSLGSHFTLPLSPFTLPFLMPRWTPESRLKQSQIIRRWKPWEQSTGPQTDLGKERSSRNAWKGGHRAAVTLWHHVLRQVTGARETLAGRYQALSRRQMLRGHEVISSFRNYALEKTPVGVGVRHLSARFTASCASRPVPPSLWPPTP